MRDLAKNAPVGIRLAKKVVERDAEEGAAAGLVLVALQTGHRLLDLSICVPL